MKAHLTHNDGFDLYKAILALLIVSIHTVHFYKVPWINFIATPIVRLAVPLFFVFSGYFFFRGITGRALNQQLVRLKNTISRNLQLYAFWFVVLLPITLYERHYFDQGLWHGIRQFIISFFLGSTFVASWYIIAFIIAVTLIFAMSKLMNNWCILTISTGIYIWCALLSNWGESPLGSFLWASLLATKVPILPYSSFTVALLWVCLGKMFAEHNFPKIGGKQSLILTVLTMLPLYFEQYVVTAHHFSVATDVFFMLPPVVFGLFSFFLSTHLTLPMAPYLRAFSTITYCLHASMSMVIVFLSAKVGISFVRFSSSVTLWFIVVALSVVATLVLVKLEKVPGLRWIRFSH